MENCVSPVGGFYLDNYVYEPCPADFYCPTEKSRKKCPEGSHSSPGSKSVNDCQKSMLEILFYISVILAAGFIYIGSRKTMSVLVLSLNIFSGQKIIAVSD